MSGMTLREAVSALRAFHAHGLASAWQPSEGERLGALAEKALAHLESIVAEQEAKEQRIYLRFNHSPGPVTASELFFPDAEALLAFVERAWLPPLPPEDEAVLVYETDEDGAGQERLNDSRFEVVNVWQIRGGLKQAVPGLAERIVAAQAAKQAFIDALGRRRRMLEEAVERQGEVDRLTRSAEQAEAFLAEHAGHLNEEGLREFEGARDKAVEARDRARGDLEALFARLPTVRRRYPGFAVCDEDLDGEGSGQNGSEVS